MIHKPVNDGMARDSLRSSPPSILCILMHPIPCILAAAPADGGLRGCASVRSPAVSGNHRYRRRCSQLLVRQLLAACVSRPAVARTSDRPDSC